MGFLLWLEPERVFQGTSWTREHPEFLLGPVGPNYLFNLGNPAARQALTDHVVKLLNDGNISCYRQDFNFDPHPFWDKADAPDRIGITEIRHITGLYQYWDDLLARCPGLLIDNCASGGRRIDIESISRSMPLWPERLPMLPGLQHHGHAESNVWPGPVGPVEPGLLRSPGHLSLPQRAGAGHGSEHAGVREGQLEAFRCRTGCGRCWAT